MQLLDFRDTIKAERYCIVERLTAGHSSQDVVIVMSEHNNVVGKVVHICN
jgi:cytidine deaminase